MSAYEQRFYLYARADRELGNSLLINLYPGLLTVNPPRLCKYFCGLTWRLLGFSMFLIHLFAWPCGSIIRGQRCELVTIIALSSEKLKVETLNKYKKESKLEKSWLKSSLEVYRGY